ncbi:hypothetical protein MRX96_047799 [Rhipicephalus microplus]
MFWKFNLITTSHVETLLSKENVTLKELMDEEDILQECKAQTKRLIEFLVKPEVMEELFEIFTYLSYMERCNGICDGGCNGKTCLYPNIACEILTSDVQQINDTLVRSETLMAKLLGFLDNDPPLNPLLASFFTKTAAMLIARKADSMFHLCMQKENFVRLLLKHIETSAIMDLLLKFVACTDSEALPQVVQELVALIDPGCSEEKHSNAAEALCEMIKLTREQMSLLQEKAPADPLLESLESTRRRASRPSSSALENAEQMTALDVERLRAGVDKVLAAVLPRLGDFLKLLTDPPQKSGWTTTFGVLDPPLGQTRLEVCHLVNALVNSNNDDVNKKLAELGALPTILDLFFEYSWNSFLHTQVAHLVSAVLSSAHSLDQEGNKVHPLLDQLLGSCALVQRCLDAWDANNLEQSEPGKHRRGYMGHLTKIVNDIVAAADGGNNSEIVRERLKDLPEDLQGRWKTFTTEALVEVNKKNTVSLAGGMPNVSSTDEDECIDLRDVSFHQEAALQQVFPRSVQQMEQVTSNFVEQFGFNDDEFVEADENLVGQLDQLARANFQLPPEVNMQSQADLFERICREKAQTLDDADSDDDIWDDKEVVVSPETRGRRRLTDDSEEPYSSDSDDENGPRPSAVATSSEEIKMDVDQSAEIDATVAMDTTSPWENAATSNVDTGWATFDNFANFGAANFEAAADTTTPAMPVAMETSDQVPSPPTLEGAAAPSSQPSNEPDSTKCPEVASAIAPVVVPSISGHCEQSTVEQKPTVESTVDDLPKVECPDSSAPKPSTSGSAVNCIELNSAEVSSSADMSIQENRVAEAVEGPADSTPACTDSSDSLKPVAMLTCANGPVPSVEPLKTCNATQISTQRLEDSSKANGSGTSVDEVITAATTMTSAQPESSAADGTDPSAPTTTSMLSTVATVPEPPTQPQVQNGPL